MNRTHLDNSSGFFDYLASSHPDLLTGLRGDSAVSVSHSTTIVAVRSSEGVVAAGDRRATEGYSIAHREMEKVYQVDEHSVVAISGAAGPCMEMVKLFSTELEFYEKVEGEVLSLEGKATFLSRLIRNNFPSAVGGLVVLPLFAGLDVKTGRGRIFRYDVTGGTYDSPDFAATGSGGQHAKATLKRLFKEGASNADAVVTAIEALTDAAEEDAATAGPDVLRDIFPTVFTIDANGVRRLDSSEVGAVSRKVLGKRERKPAKASAKS